MVQCGILIVFYKWIDALFHFRRDARTVLHHPARGTSKPKHAVTEIPHCVRDEMGLVLSFWSMGYLSRQQKYLFGDIAIGLPKRNVCAGRIHNNGKLPHISGCSDPFYFGGTMLLCLSQGFLHIIY